MLKRRGDKEYIQNLHNVDRIDVLNDKKNWKWAVCQNNEEIRLM